MESRSHAHTLDSRAKFPRVALIWSIAEHDGQGHGASGCWCMGDLGPASATSRPVLLGCGTGELYSWLCVCLCLCLCRCVYVCVYVRACVRARVRVRECVSA